MRGSVQKYSGKRGVSWSYVIDLGRTPEGKRDQKRRRGFPTKKAAEEAMQRELHERRSGTYVERTPLTVDTYLKKWLAHYAPTVAPSTAAIKERHVRLYLSPALGAIDLASLSPLQVQDAYAKMQDRLGPATIGIIHRTLRLALEQAARWDLVPRNVVTAAKPPRVARRERRIWSSEQTAAFLASTRDDEKYGAIWAVAAGTGLRRAELLGLHWSDVDLERNLLTVRKSRTKTPAGARTLRLPKPAATALRAHRARQNVRRLALGSGWHDTDIVFDQGDGRPLPARTVNGAFTRAILRSNLPAIRLHDLRHGYATVLARARIPIKTVSTMLGHANVGITLDLYTHLDLVDQDLAVTALEDAFADPSENQVEGQHG